MRLNSDVLKKVQFLSGDASNINRALETPARQPFDDEMIAFLNEVSRLIMGNPAAKGFPDVVTFGFWLRKGSIENLKKKYLADDGVFRIGKGIVFHIAPSNVPVNFAYSLVSGLLNGNMNIVRVPSKDFDQVRLISEAINKALDGFEGLKPFVNLVRYDRDKEINDLFSSICDMRVIWGGDETIAEIRKSPLPPRSGEITFADRYSLAVIDSDAYLAFDDKTRIALDFYNDTYLTDQNACTSPRIVVWMGDSVGKARDCFWKEEHGIVGEKYDLKAVQAVNKLTSTYLSAVYVPGCKVISGDDNLIVRIEVPKAEAYLMEHRDNSGFFFEYVCHDIMEIRDLADDKHCQTVSYIGDKEMITPLIASGVKGIDRIVPIGKTMDFDLMWDGYDLTRILTRAVKVG